MFCKGFLFCFLAFGVMQSADIANSIESMKKQLSTLKDNIEKQNKKIYQKINLSKVTLLESKRNVFFVRQKNELLMNSAYIEALNQN